MMEILGTHQPSDNKALDSEPPIMLFLKSLLIGGGLAAAQSTAKDTTTFTEKLTGACLGAKKITWFLTQTGNFLKS